MIYNKNLCLEGNMSLTTLYYLLFLIGCIVLKLPTCIPFQSTEIAISFTQFNCNRLAKKFWRPVGERNFMLFTAVSLGPETVSEGWI